MVHYEGFRCDTILILLHLPCSFCLVFNIVFFSLFIASVHLQITDEQEAFICRVQKIPLGQRKWKDLVTLDTLHTYCGGPELSPITRGLNTYSLLLTSAFPNIRFFILSRDGSKEAESVGKAISCGMQAVVARMVLSVGLQGHHQRDVKMEE